MMFKRLPVMVITIGFAVSIAGCASAPNTPPVNSPHPSLAQTTVSEPTPSPEPSTLGPSQGYILDNGLAVCTFVDIDTNVYFDNVGSCDQAAQFISQVTGIYWQTAFSVGNAGLPLADTVCVFQVQGDGSTVAIVSVGAEGDAICQDFQANGWIPEPGA